MGDKTGISWTDATWNPVRGCSAVSPGCAHCYAEQQAARIVRMGKGKPTAYDGLVELVGKEQVPRWTGKVRVVLEHLADPLRWTKPRRIFVNSMSDLFHEELSNDEIAAVFGVMAAAPQHTFQVLTKRAQRMNEWFRWLAANSPCAVPGMETECMRITLHRAAEKLCPEYAKATAGKWWGFIWPLPNVWMGVSVEDQLRRDRIPYLLETPAAVRFLSCEPLLEELDVAIYLHPAGAPRAESNALDWIIAGCESGPGARPVNVAAFRSLRDQCARFGTAFFLKQVAGPVRNAIGGGRHMVPIARVRDGTFGAVRAGDGSKTKAGGVIELPYLDGVQHAEFPVPTTTTT